MAKSILQTLKEMRTGSAPREDEPDVPVFDVDLVRQAISKDRGLRPAQAKEVLRSMDDPDFVAEIKSGAIGAALTALIAHYLKLKPQNQLLLSIAGFGIGKIIYDYKHNPENFSRYNPKLKMYDIK